MQRAERLGLGVSAAGHVLLFGALSLGFLAARPIILSPPPMEVDLVSEVAPTSTTPTPSKEPPAPATAPEIAPPEPAPPPPPIPPPPKPAPKAEPKPVPKPEPKPKPPAPAKPLAAAKPNARPGNRPVALALSDDIAKGAASERTPKPNATPAPDAAPAPLGPQQQRALNAEISRQLKNHWRAPSGADADQLVTTLRWRLNPDGSLASGPDLVSQSGKTDSNRPQQQLHIEAAMKAVRAAEPFNLPAEYYDYWKNIVSFRFDKRL